MTLKDLKWERICSSYFVDPICFVGILKFSWYEVHRQLEDVNAVFRSWNVEKRLGYFIFNNSGFIKKTWLFFVCEKGLVIETGKEKQKKHLFSKRSLILSLFAPCFCCWKKSTCQIPIGQVGVIMTPMGPMAKAPDPIDDYHEHLLLQLHSWKGRRGCEQIREKVVDFLDFGRNFHDF